jgi:hypothetical protein
MAVTVERLPDEPIILAHVSGHMSMDDAKTIFARSAELMQAMSGHIFRITDVREMDTDFGEVLEMLREASQGGPGSTSDPNLSVVMVGGHALTKFFADAMSQKQFGGVAVPVFTEMDDALTYVRYKLRAET